MNFLYIFQNNHICVERCRKRKCGKRKREIERVEEQIHETEAADGRGEHQQQSHQCMYASQACTTTFINFSAF